VSALSIALAGYLSIGLACAGAMWVALRWAERQDDMPIERAEMRAELRKVPGGVGAMLLAVALAWPFVVVNYLRQGKS
jgi:hypothetical protein